MNFDSRPSGVSISVLVLHYTGMASHALARRRLTSQSSNVSAHYLVSEQGQIEPLVKEKDRAWHAGTSLWRGRCNINDCSIGIEITNPGHDWGYVPFPKRQMQAVAELCLDITRRHHIPIRNLVGHSDIACRRKRDPGELFDWAYLAGRGVGLWPELAGRETGEETGGACDAGEAAGADKDTGGVSRTDEKADAIALDGLLAEIGYAPDSPWHIQAFQRRFRPQRVDGRADGETIALARKLLAMFRAIN